MSKTVHILALHLPKEFFNFSFVNVRVIFPHTFLAKERKRLLQVKCERDFRSLLFVTFFFF
ncbi:hypothetical protein N2I72_13310, partial [Enterococcus faecium]|nr:hypothetical protein [Enterococcus faecium]MCU1831681.1 hypothetical protein [Enterococcus faecium]